MDLRLLSAEPSDAEREAIDTVVGGAAADDGRVARADRTRRHLLLPALRAAQRRVGWVSEGALGYASRRLDVPPAEAYGVATFYALLSLEERPRRRAARVHRPRVPARRRRGSAGRARVAVPRALRARTGVAAHDRRPGAARASAARRAARRCRSAASPACACCGASRPTSIRSRSTPTARTAATPHFGARSSSARRACCARSTSRGCSAAAAPRSRPARSGRPSRTRPCSRTTSSATRTSPSRERSRTAS